MCGIYCFIGHKKALPIVLDGLATLEYRGYDSSGIAYVSNHKLNIIKEKGRLINLEKKINKETDTNMAIGHTRWATHGSPNTINAHPHKQGKITLVHNGIIENYEELKLILKDYKLKSETDTEVLACLIDKLYKEKNDIILVLSKLNEIVRGSYALGIILDDDFDSIYAIRKNSPLILAKSEIGNFIASDIPAILKYTNKYILLDNDEIACLTKNDIKIYDSKLKLIDKQINIFDGDFESACKNGYEHFMLKEIYEQPDIISKTFLTYTQYGIESLNKLPKLKNYNIIHIVACGSAYHAGLIGKNLIERYCNIPVNVEVASEYRYKKCFYNQKTLVIFISQSGETADTLACIKKVKEANIDTLGIVNVVGSSIAREVKDVIYTKAGCEIAVATTKAFSSQIAVLALIALANSNISDIEYSEILREIQQLPEKINILLNNNYEKIANYLYKENDIFFIGRGIDYSICLEGSLKLKEISYTHSEAYPAGELKHGTISLIDKNTPVIAISTEENLNEKMISNIKEVKARNANVIYITSNKLDTEDNFYDKKIVIPDTHYLFRPILTVIPLQLLAYYVAKYRKCDIDKPKNLAKSVTVE